MSQIETQILEEICQSGPMPFSRFMELALYCPDYGFYEKEGDTIGRSGHFFTSVSVGPLFGELLAFTIACRLPSLPGTPLLIEAGAHDGKLAQDVLNWFKLHRPDSYARLLYVIVERSERRREWQAAQLKDHLKRIVWTNDFNFYENQSLHPHVCGSGGVNGILFCNELLDAFPVHRLSWSKGERQWKECCVEWDNGHFKWCVREIGDPQVRASLPSRGNPVLEHLPDGYIIEISTAAANWWGSAAKALEVGALVAFDYGFSDEDRLSPVRNGGTLRAYRGHKCSLDVLEFPGESDLTAHVDFPEIIRIGERSGFRTEVFQTQGRFLARLATEIPTGDTFAPPWDKPRIRQFSTLTHPEYLGQSFKVLIQSKGTH